MGEIIIPSIKCSVFDAHEVSLARARTKKGRVVFRVTKSMLKAQDSRLRHRAFVELLFVGSAGRKRRKTPYRHVDMVKGKSGENSVA